MPRGGAEWIGRACRGAVMLRPERREPSPGGARPRFASRRARATPGRASEGATRTFVFFSFFPHYAVQRRQSCFVLLRFEFNVRGERSVSELFKPRGRATRLRGMTFLAVTAPSNLEAELARDLADGLRRRGERGARRRVAHGHGRRGGRGRRREGRGGGGRRRGLRRRADGDDGERRWSVAVAAFEDRIRRASDWRHEHLCDSLGVSSHSSLLNVLHQRHRFKGVRAAPALESSSFWWRRLP